MKYLLFILLLAGCGAPVNQLDDLDQLYAVEDELTAEIKRLKQNLRESADDDDIEDLEDEIEDLEDRLRRVKNQERVIETERRTIITKEGTTRSNTAFCSRTPEVRYAIKDTFNRANTPIDSCGQVTDYMLTRISITNPLDLTDVESFKSGDLDGLPKGLKYQLPLLTKSKYADIFDVVEYANLADGSFKTKLHNQISIFNNNIISVTAPTTCAKYDKDRVQAKYAALYNKAQSSSLSLFTYFKSDFHEGTGIADNDKKYAKAREDHRSFRTKPFNCNTYSRLSW